MKANLQIGITGGIGSGKSMVCRIFQCLGIPVYDADQQARKLMATDETIIREIKKEFSDQSYQSDGSLNRPYLAQTVFAVREKVERLNQIVHPRVGLDYLQWINLHSHAPYLIKEAALLFEAGTFRDLYRMVVVTAPEKLRIQRVLQRDPGRTEQNVRDIMANQMREEEKTGRADFVIVNDESRLLIPQVLELHKKFGVMSYEL